MLKDTKYTPKILTLLTAFAGTYGIGYLSFLITGSFLTNSYLSLCIFGALSYLLYHTYSDIAQINDKKSAIRRIIFAFFTALCFAVTLVFGYQLKATGMTECGIRGKGLIFLRSLALSFSLLPFSNLLYKWAENTNKRPASVNSKQKHPLRIFFICWSVIFIFWIPVFLAYYPAVMGFDFHRQSQEAMKGFVWFNNYQPLAHTLLIWVAFQIGNIFGSLQTGMAFYSIFQMLVFSAACAYSCSIVLRLLSIKWPVVALTLFYALFPYNSILSVGVTKDVLFSAFFLIFISLFVERTFLAEREKMPLLNILWILSGILMILFRNNALYAVSVFMLVYFIIAPKKQRMKILIMAICLIVGGKGALEGLQFALGTQGRGSKVEMFSVPIQQFARVGYFHKDTLDTDTYALIDTYVPEKYWSKYNPPLSDSVKNWIGAVVFEETWKNHYTDMLSAWVQIGLKYPNEYLDAFLLLTSGYWFIDDVSYAEVLGFGVEERMGALHTYNSTISDVIPEGIEHETKFAWLENKLEEIISGNSYYSWPVVSNLFKPAFYCWILLLTLFLCFYRYNREKLLTVLFPLVYLATMFLGPVVQVRYALPIIISVPLVLATYVFTPSPSEIPRIASDTHDKTPNN